MWRVARVGYGGRRGERVVCKQKEGSGRAIEGCRGCVAEQCSSGRRARWVAGERARFRCSVAAWLERVLTAKQ